MENIFENSAKKLRVRRLENINTFPHIHDSDEIEIMILLEGSADCSINGKFYEIKKGDVAFITPYQSHTYSHKKTVDTLSFIIGREFYHEFYRFFINHILHNPVINISSDTTRIMDNITALLYDLSLDNKDSTIIEGHALIIIRKLIKILTFENTNQSNFNIKNNFLLAAQKYCSENYAQNITIKELAQIVNVHPNHLSATFNKHFGISPVKYLNICRLRRACEMLNNSDLSTTEIAMRCGFQSVRTFNRTFKSELNCTPREYKKRKDNVVN